MTDEIVRDLRYGLRLLLRKPGFAAIAVLTLGLGIGVNSTVFTWAKSIVFDPLPGVSDPARLVNLHSTLSGQGNQPIQASYLDYRDFRDRNRVFSGLMASTLAPLNLGGGERPERIWGELVSANYFNVLGAAPAKGRGFLPDEETDNRAVAVISYDIWQDRFSGDSGIIGKTVLLNKRSFTVIGVTSQRFQGAWGGLHAQVWIPICFEPVLSQGSRFPGFRGSRGLQLTGRLRDGVSIQQAQEDSVSIAGTLASEFPGSNKNIGAIVLPLNKEPYSAASYLTPAVTALLVIAGLVLLIACANIANLLLVQGSSRQRELAVRAAIGASRLRIARQLLAEAMVLSVLGGVAGLVLARWSGGFLNSLVPSTGFPIQFSIGVDGRVVGFTAVATLLTLLIAALAPSLQSSKIDLISNLKEGERGASSGSKRARLRSILVAAQVSLSLVALIAAGLLIRSLQKAQNAYGGFNPDNVLVGSVDLFAQGYDSSRGTTFLTNLLSAVKSQPGVTSVTLADNLPLRLVGGNGSSMSVEGYTPAPGEQMNVEYSVVGPDYFKTLDSPMVEGRDFTDADNSTQPRAIVINNSFAKRYFAGRDPLGHFISVWGGEKWRVIGVVRDIKELTLNEPAEPYAYFPVLQNYTSIVKILVRTAGSPAAALLPLEDTVHSMDPNLPIFDTKSLSAAAGASLLAQKLSVKLLTVFAALGMLLASVGIYGVIAYSVAQRRHEIGIRLALGASRSQMIALALRGGMVPAVAGIAAGLGAALFLTRFMGDLLYGVSPWDPLTYVATVTVLLLVALTAALIPGRKAARVDPMLALRYE